MLNTKPFETIKSFCKEHKVDPIYEKLLYHKFITEYDDFYKTTSCQPDSVITEDQDKTLIDSLLHQNTLAKNLDIVTSEIDDMVKDKSRWIELKYKIKNWIGNIGLNILASIIFMFMLYGFYIMAEKEIKPKIQEYLSSETETVQQK